MSRGSIPGSELENPLTVSIQHRFFMTVGQVMRSPMRLVQYGLLFGGTVVVGILLHVSTWEMAQEELPVIYIITPTHRRHTQKADLTRLANTLRQVPSLHWIVVEDATSQSTLVAGVLARSGLPYTHMNVPRPDFCKTGCVARGTEQRNLGMEWLRKNRGPQDSGVVYFADDDNTYDLQLFEEMRYTKHVSVWPVGLIAARWYERPKVRDGKVVGWYTGFGGRKFGTDMAGFAVNLSLILANPQAQFVLKGAKRGMQETDFLRQLTTVQDLEPKANNCTKVLVWHTRTEFAPLYQHVPENIVIEV
ncbi:galactosylgalactosylxylosylprotein 3-beta-glucuronosyltransferase 2-like [Engraulis encrasicolus]|uniref:galactosylgalactosylxylosylprotein 3-beta-glucuronosyltransferase 2-like n=1 Tax=Engraulis encrasicolus TaxID=184585 RepID=UPI002FD42CA8